MHANARILTLNAGSSSIKFALFAANPGLQRVRKGKIDRIGLADATLAIDQATATGSTSRTIAAPNHSAAIAILLDWLDEQVDCRGKGLWAGHRVVHGGPQYVEPRRIDAAMVKNLVQLIPFSPEHLPQQIHLIEQMQIRFPNLPQVACFDTAFHRALPSRSRLLPIPRRFFERGVRRYGFHGVSYTFLMEELGRISPEAARGRVILAHLGNGASLAAVRDGQCLDTTMGFTPAAGIPMSTRSGDLDPGLIRYFAQVEGMTPAEFDRMINRESGLLGISETSSDMRDLRSRAKDDSRAAEAIEIFCYSIRKTIGAFAAALGGLDTLVFSGGIGEHSATVRSQICDPLAFLGLQLDARRSGLDEPVISAPASNVTVRVIRTDEELVIAREVAKLAEQSR